MANPVAALAARLALSTEASIVRRLVLDRHASVAKSIWPSATVSPVGSFAQNTSLAGSDLDVVVHIPDLKYERSTAARWAKILQTNLVAQKITMGEISEVIGGARVPILTYIDREARVGVDVSFLPNSIANTEYVKTELELRPYMRTMLILLKYWLKSRNMNKTYSGGLGSYALSLMVIGYFNVRKHTKARKRTEAEYAQWLVDQDIYHLLIDYLTFWASQWKYARHMLEPSDGGIYKKGSEGRIGHRNKLLAIVDPMDPKNDVTMNTSKIKALRDAMKLLKDRLMLVGPKITAEELLDLLENTGKLWGNKRNSKDKKLFSKRRKGGKMGSPNATSAKKKKVLKNIAPGRRADVPTPGQLGVS